MNGQRIISLPGYVIASGYTFSLNKNFIKKGFILKEGFVADILGQSFFKNIMFKKSFPCTK